MNDRNTEQQLRYLGEVCTCLYRAGFETTQIEDSQLPVEWNQDHSGVYAADGDGALFESRRSGGRLQGAGGFQRHCAGWSSEQTRSLLCHMGLGLWTHRRMPWSLFHGELCRSQTGLRRPLGAYPKGAAL